MCDNKFCYWNFDGSCVHESEEGHENAMPNSLDCPSSLRGDFDEARILLWEEIKERINYLSFVEMIKIRDLLVKIEKDERMIVDEK